MKNKQLILINLITQNKSKLLSNVLAQFVNKMLLENNRWQNHILAHLKETISSSNKFPNFDCVLCTPCYLLQFIFEETRVSKMKQILRYETILLAAATQYLQKLIIVSTHRSTQHCQSLSQVIEKRCPKLFLTSRNQTHQANHSNCQRSVQASYEISLRSRFSQQK